MTGQRHQREESVCRRCGPARGARVRASCVDECCGGPRRSLQFRRFMRFASSPWLNDVLTAQNKQNTVQYLDHRWPSGATGATCWQGC